MSQMKWFQNLLYVVIEFDAPSAKRADIEVTISNSNFSILLKGFTLLQVLFFIAILTIRAMPFRLSKVLQSGQLEETVEWYVWKK